MLRALVMTIIGEDRPGLVESVAALVAGHGGNWLESRMSRLGGQFAGILRIEIPSEAEPTLIQALQSLSARGLTVVAHSEAPESAPLPGHRCVLEVVAQDRPGIVRQITSALAGYGVNVEDLETECESAAMSGETLFKARATVSIPPSADTSAIRQTLEKIAADLIAEVRLEDV